MTTYDCDTQYKELVKRILSEGEEREDRTGTGTISVFGGQMKFDLRERFPLVQCKETRYKVAFLEMLWFLRGEGNTKYLNENGCKLWDAWADENGNLGSIYGFSWRKWGAKPTNVPQPIPKLRDGVLPTYLGVGNGSGKEGHPLAKTWEALMIRCYDKKHWGYRNYGGKGVSVCDDWLEFRKFAKDAEQLPGYEDKIRSKSREYALDKDILGNGFLYSKDTCAWVSSARNNAEKHNTIYVVEKGGIQYEFDNIKKFCDEHGVESKNFSDLWTGTKNAKIRGGFSFVRKYDKRKSTDQVKQVVEGIKNNPHGRRHIVTAWNVAELENMALPPCHWWHQLYAVGDEYLDLRVDLRSNDVGLGNPFNIAQYALLQHLYARATGRKPRYLIYQYGDAHLYKDHVEAMKEVVEREAIQDNAQIVFHTDNTDIDGYKLEDFEIVGYKSHSFVKLPVSV